MEPFTTTWFLTTVISGWIGNRSDFFLREGANELFNRSTAKLSKPSNLIIEKSIRRSYLKATLLAISHIQSKRRKISFTDARWGNIEEVRKFVKNEIGLTNSNEYKIKSISEVNSYQKILFPKTDSATKLNEAMICNLRESIIKELEGYNRKVEQPLKDCIMTGWTEGEKEFDFYNLTCAFFTKELNENSELSNSIQTDYLDNIKDYVENLNLSIEILTETLNEIYEEYREVIPLMEKLFQTIEDVKSDLKNIPEETAKLVLDGIREDSLSVKNFSASKEYTSFIKKIGEIDSNIENLNTQINGLESAIKQVDESTQLTLQSNLEKSETELLEKSRERNQIELELNNFVKDVIQLSKQLQEANVDESQRLKRAMELFKEGRFNEINDLLNEGQIDEELTKIKERKGLLSNELVVKAQAIIITKPENWFTEANRIFLKALSVEKSINATYSYAFFLAEQNQINKAIDYYNQSFNLSSDDIQRGKILNNIGHLHHLNNDISKSEKSYKKALKIRRNLADRNSKAHLLSVVHSLNNLGVLQREKNDFINAEKSFQEALDILRKLEHLSSGKYLIGIGKTLNNLGILRNVQKEFAKAEECYQEAIDIFRMLSENNSQFYLFTLGEILNNLGVLQREKNDFINAEKSYKESLEIFRKLVKTNPHKYLPIISNVLDNLGTLKENISEFSKSEEFFREALLIRRSLAGLNYNSYSGDLSKTLNNLGVLLKEKNEFSKAEEYLKESLAIRRELARVSPQIYLIGLGMTLNNLGLLERHKNEFSKSEEYFQESLKIMR